MFIISIKDQLIKLKENWLLVAILVVLVLLISGGNIVTQSIGGLSRGYSKSYPEQSIMAERSYYPSPSVESFAPEVEERKITKTARLSTEVKTGRFKEEEVRLKSIISSSQSILLNENVNKHETPRKSYYYTGSYHLKVDVKKYDAVINQLKEIGEVKSFNENQNDITGQYTNLELEIKNERLKLERYEDMYKKATIVEDQIRLTELIFNLERRIQYLEESLKNQDLRIDYSTVYLTISEKTSDYANILFVKLSELISNLVNSINSLLILLFWIAPWVVAWLIIKFTRKMLKR